MQDFRKFVVARPPPSLDDIAQLFRQGELIEGVKLCNKIGIDNIRFTEDIEKGAKRRFLMGQPGFLLSFIHKYRVTIPYEIPELLQAMIDVGDNETNFLKQVHRFQQVNGFEANIQEAIGILERNGFFGSAEAWRRKIAEISG